MTNNTYFIDIFTTLDDYFMLMTSDREKKCLSSSAISGLIDHQTLFLPHRLYPNFFSLYCRSIFFHLICRQMDLGIIC